MGKFLVALFFISLPFQENLYYAGYSISFVLMGLIGFYALVFRLRQIEHVISKSKTFRAISLFIFGIIILEFLHVNPSFEYMWRHVLILVSVAFLASILLGKNGVKFVAHAYLISSILAAIFLIYYGFSSIFSGEVSGLGAAEAARDEVSDQLIVKQDFNNLAFNSGMGALLAFSFFLSKKRKKTIYILVATLTFVGMIITMSRGGLITFGLSLLFVLWYFRIGKGKNFVFVLSIFLIGLVIIPSTFFERFKFNIAKDAIELDGRIRVFYASIDAISENWLWGVGEGNFWSYWAKNSDFAKFNKGEVSVLGSHNLFFQILINWGILGLYLFLRYIHRLFLLKPDRKYITADGSLFMIITIGCLLYMAQIHNIHTKDFLLLFTVAVIYEMGILTNRLDGLNNMKYLNGEISS